MRLLLSTAVMFLILAGQTLSQQAEIESVRSIDFKNFNYPVVGSVSPFAMVNGYFRRESRACTLEYSLKEVVYRDVTDDGEDEAIAVVNDKTNCAGRKPATRYYIYTLVDNRPRFLRRQSAEYNPNIPRLTELRVSRNSITHPCPPGTTPHGDGCPDDGDPIIDVEALPSDTLPEGATINYEVTGGRIDHSGHRPVWDLAGARPGSYKISAQIVMGDARSNSRSETVIIQGCPNCMRECVCPTLAVAAPSTTQPAGSILQFTANVSGGRERGFTYNWTVSEGTIVGGQGTRSIQVQSSAAMAGRRITATVTIAGSDPTCNCPASASVDSQELGSANQ